MIKWCFVVVDDSKDETKKRGVQKKEGKKEGMQGRKGNQGINDKVHFVLKMSVLLQTEVKIKKVIKE